MGTRAYDATNDLEHVLTIWREAGWVDSTDTAAAAVKAFYEGGNALVAPENGQFEAVAHWSSGRWHYLDRDLTVGAITGILTGRAGRRQGLATDVVAESLAQIHEHGFALATLGAFEQGYYDRFGFGSDVYEHTLTFDPASLKVAVPDRAPVRISPDDHAEFHALLKRRRRPHGGMYLDAPELMKAEWGWVDKWWGLGFRDESDQRLVAAMVGSADDENGPYRVAWMAYETPELLLDLLGVLRSLADQVMLVRMQEPAEIRLQDVIAQPSRQRTRMVMDGRQHGFNSAFSWRQNRMIDLAACIGVVSTPFELSFDLRLTDPLAERGGRWKGVGGAYHVRLGETSDIHPGHRGGPVVTTDVGSLTRLWSGARPATALALLGHLSGPADLLATLDLIFRLPDTKPGISY